MTPMLGVLDEAFGAASSEGFSYAFDHVGGVAQMTADQKNDLKLINFRIMLILIQRYST